MRNVHSQNTAPEVAFKNALTARGLSFLESPPDLPGKPDVVLPANMLAIFIDGDFWHGGQWRKRKLTQLEDQFQKTTTKAYWLKKIRRNMERDFHATAKLLASGWTVLRFWESALSRDLEGCVNLAVSVVENGASPTCYAMLPERSVAEFFAGIG